MVVNLPADEGVPAGIDHPIHLEVKLQIGQKPEHGGDAKGGFVGALEAVRAGMEVGQHGTYQGGGGGGGVSNAQAHDREDAPVYLAAQLLAFLRSDRVFPDVLAQDL